MNTITLTLPVPSLPNLTVDHWRQRISEVIRNRREWLTRVPDMIRLQPGCGGTSVCEWQSYEQGHIDDAYNWADDLRSEGLDDRLGKVVDYLLAKRLNEFAPKQR